MRIYSLLRSYSFFPDSKPSKSLLTPKLMGVAEARAKSIKVEPVLLEYKQMMQNCWLMLGSCLVSICCWHFIVALDSTSPAKPAVAQQVHRSKSSNFLLRFAFKRLLPQDIQHAQVHSGKRLTMADHNIHIFMVLANWASSASHPQPLPVAPCSPTLVVVAISMPYHFRRWSAAPWTTPKRRMPKEVLLLLSLMFCCVSPTMSPSTAPCPKL